MTRVISTLCILLVASQAFAWQIGQPGSFGSGNSGSTFSAGSAGFPSLGVRNDGASSVLAPVNGGYGPFAIDSTGRLIVSATIAEAATSPAGATYSAGSLFKLAAGINSSSVVHALQLDGSNQLLVNNAGNTQPISAASLPLPTGSATSANQTSGGQKAQVVDGAGNVQPAGDVAARKIFTQPTDGTNSQAYTASSEAKVSVTSSLPAGANTIGGVTQVSGPWSVNATQVGGAALALGQAASSASIPVVTASDQVAPKSYANINGSTVQSLTVGSGASVVFSSPAGAVGYVAQAPSSNTQNVRCGQGITPSSTFGLRLEPGRDTGFVPSGMALSCISESGSSQEVDVLWILR